MNNRFSIARALLAMAAVAVPLGLFGRYYEGLWSLPALLIGVPIAVLVLLANFAEVRRALFQIAVALSYVFFGLLLVPLTSNGSLHNLPFWLAAALYFIAGLFLFRHLAKPKRSGDG